MHDPEGHPYASLPLGDFLAAWRAETLDYGTPDTLRHGFARVAEVSEIDAVRASIPAAIRWLSADRERAMPAGSLANGAAAERLAALERER